MPECKTCRFFVLKRQAYGFCHRYPRATDHVDTHWCGEYLAVGLVAVPEPDLPTPVQLPTRKPKP